MNTITDTDISTYHHILSWAFQLILSVRYQVDKRHSYQTEAAGSAKQKPHAGVKKQNETWDFITMRKIK